MTYSVARTTRSPFMVKTSKLIHQLRKDATRWQYMQQPGYWEFIHEDGHFSIGVGDCPDGETRTGKGATRKEAIDMAIFETKFKI